MLKKYYLIICCIVSFIDIYAQNIPQNDNCISAVTLSVPCNITANSDNARASLGILPKCFEDSIGNRDVWFKFSPNEAKNYCITVSSLTLANHLRLMKNPQIALYTGDCSNLQLIACISAPFNNRAITLETSILSIGINYFVQISDYGEFGEDNSGLFTLQVMTCSPKTEYIMNNQITTENAGTLYDDGGKNADYKQSTNYNFTILPQNLSNNENIDLKINYYDIGIEDTLNIYEGKNDKAFLLASINYSNPMLKNKGSALRFKINSSAVHISLLKKTNGQIGKGFELEWTIKKKNKHKIKLLKNRTEYDIYYTYSNQNFVDSGIGYDCQEANIGVFEYEGDDSEVGMSKGIVMGTAPVENLLTEKNIVNDSIKNVNQLYYLDSTFLVPFKNTCNLYMFTQTKSSLKIKYAYGTKGKYENIGNGLQDAFLMCQDNPFLGKITKVHNLFQTNKFIGFDEMNYQKNADYIRPNVYKSTSLNTYLYSNETQKKCFQPNTLLTGSNIFSIGKRSLSAAESFLFVSPIVNDDTPKATLKSALHQDTLYEGCTIDTIEFTLPKANAKKIQFRFQKDAYGFSMTGLPGKFAKYGEDYKFLSPDTMLTFNPGVTTIKYPIQILEDNIKEGVEVFLVNLWIIPQKNYNYPNSHIHFYIKDRADIQTKLLPDTIRLCNNSTQIEGLKIDNVNFAPNGIVSKDKNNLQIKSSKDQTLQYNFNIGTCLFQGSSFLYNQEMPKFASKNIKVCNAKDSITLNLPSDKINEFYWSNDGLSINSKSKNYKILPAANAKYYLFGNIEGCYFKDSITTQVSSPKLSIDKDTTDFCKNELIELKSSNNGGKITWSTTTLNELSNTSTNNVKVKVIENGWITLYLDQNGCILKDSIQIRIKDEDKCIAEVLVPKVITPDTNDDNSEFKPILPTGASLKNIIIFNRWGEIIHNAPSPWNGKNKNNPCPTDVYLFIMKVDLPNGIEKEIKGEVIVLR